MKTVLIVVISLFLIFVIAQFFIHRSSTRIEMYPYALIETVGDIEIRNYEARLFTSVPIVDRSYKEASSGGFSKLGAYIFGANESNEKIAMTSPVSMKLGDDSSMQFMVPKTLKKDELPVPIQSDITFIEEPSKTMAIRSFGGWANDRKIEDNKQQLIKTLKEKEIPFSDKFYLFGYNPPYDFFFRRNEVAVELVK
ncbi:MAG: hypothetical protein ACJAX3_001961 [Patiriisocius sp.]|jgi:hypothetical protein